MQRYAQAHIRSTNTSITKKQDKTLGMTPYDKNKNKKTPKLHLNNTVKNIAGKKMCGLYLLL